MIYLDISVGVLRRTGRLGTVDFFLIVSLQLTEVALLFQTPRRGPLTPAQRFVALPLGDSLSK